jgi:proline iminopeptidase
MIDHVGRYLSSGGTDSHIPIKLPNVPEKAVQSLLLTTTGRKSGEKYLFPLFYGRAGDGYFVIASKGGAPKHPGWYRNILANPEVDIQVGTAKMRARARTAAGEGAAVEQAVRPPFADPAQGQRTRIPVVVLDPFLGLVSAGPCP